MTTTMKEAIIAPSLHTTIEETSIPTPKEGEVIVRIVVAGANPIDWKGADEEVAKAMHGLLKNPLHRNAGKDFAGFVHAVGPKVYGFKVGDRVISLNHSSGYAEYGVGPAFSTAHIPDNISFEEAATTGLAYITAALGLYKHLSLPLPFTPSPTSKQTPLLIYGATSATGLYAVKLAHLSNVHPIIAIAGSSGPGMVSEYLNVDRGDVLLDYRVGAERLRSQVRAGLKGASLGLVYDSISTNSTVDLLSPLLTPSSSSQQPTYVLLLDGPHRQRIPTGIKTENPFAPGLWEPTDPDSPYEASDGGVESKNIIPRAFTQAFFGYLTFALGEGILKGHPFEVVSGGLRGIEGAMKGLRDGRNGGSKYVFRVGETEGL